MARPLRIEYSNAFYHVIQRGINGKVIFASDRDCERFFRYLRAAHDRYEAVVHTLVLMTNHYHVILETPRGNLSKIMHYLNMSYATYFNSRRKRHGPLYQGRFKAVLVQQDQYLHHLSRYIHLNPVRAGIVEDPLEYRWSSLKYFAANSSPPGWLNTKFILSMFDKNAREAEKMYWQFLLNEIGHEKDIIEKKTKAGIILGDEPFVEAIGERFIYGKKDSEVPVFKKMKKEPCLEYIKELVEREVGGSKRLQRKVAIYLSRKYTQKTLREIADFYGELKYTGVSQSFRRTENEMGSNESLNNLVLRLEKALNV